MKKILLLISIVCFGQQSFAAILHVKDSRSGAVGKKFETLIVAANWEDGQKERVIPRDERFHGIDSHFHSIDGVSWVDRGMFYWVSMLISPLSTSHQLEILSGGWCKYDGRLIMASQAPIDMESD
jgi:hypothetical protein